MDWLTCCCRHCGFFVWLLLFVIVLCITTRLMLALADWFVR